MIVRILLRVIVILGLLVVCCKSETDNKHFMNTMEHDKFADIRLNMVANQIYNRGVHDSLVLEAMRTVPRHKFVDKNLAGNAYEDFPLSIGSNQTISQPYIVALMTDLLDLSGGEKVLEIGTGSGYQAAVLAEICDSVYTIEIIESLANSSRDLLDSLSYDNIKVIYGDGYQGYKQAAPYDGIIVTAAPGQVPQPLFDQLAIGAKLVIPVGGKLQYLKVFERTQTGIKESTNISVRFVPMTGEAEK